MTLRAAVINLRCGTDIDANFLQAEHQIRSAHADGAKFIVTPENTLLMATNAKSLFNAIKPEHETRAVEQYGALAHELSVDLLIGSMAVKLSDEKAANRSYLFGCDGTIKARYDKIHMFDVTINETETWKESANYQAGDAPVTAEIRNFKIGMSVCYDLRFANLYKFYANQGAHIMTVPSAFTAVTGEAHWQTLLRARSIETSSYVLAAAQGGTHENGRATWGHSMIIDPWGKIIAEIPNDEPGFCCANLNVDMVNDIRRRIPAWTQNTVFNAPNQTL